MVVGIHGPWGDGKTTVLNMLQADLEADGETATVEFNPWRFTDEPSMLAGFFRVLAGVIRAKLTTPSEAVAGWIEKIGRYASVVDTRLGRAGEVAEAHAEASLEELRSRLSEALTSADKRIVVLVDDIDRLDKHETHTLFRLAYFTGGKARRVIERMRQREASTSPQAVASLCVAIAANAKHIPNPPSPFSFAEAVSQAGILISRLIERLPGGTPRVTLAKQVIEAADPLWFGAEVLRWLHVTDDADKADSNTLTKEEVKEVGKALVERIKARARAGEPLFNVDVPQEQSLLYEWWRVEGREPVQAHLASVFAKDPKNIALFLQAMAPRSWGEGDVLPRVGKLDGDQLKNIKLIYDLDALAQLIREHLPGNFENPQWYPDSSNPIGQRLAEQFMFVYNKSKKDGEPPDRGSSGQADDTPADDEDD